MAERFPIGSTARVYLDLIESGVGAISQSPTASVQRVSDGAWLDVNGEWQTAPTDHIMTQLSSALQPGRYYFDFDQSLDVDAGASPRYIVKLWNTGTPVALEYRDIVFGQEPRTAALDVCAIQGTIANAQGVPVKNALVRALVQPIFRDALGRAVQADTVVQTYSDSNGDFEIPLVRGAIVRLEIPAVGYDRKLTVPDQASAIFTEL